MSNKRNTSHFRVAIVSHDSEDVPSWVIEQVEKAGVEISCKACRTKEDLAEAGGHADVVWVFGGWDILSGEHVGYLDVLRACGAVIRSGSGTDNVAVDQATKRGILVCNTPDATAEEVSDHAIGLYFALIRRIGTQNRLMRDGIWDLTRGHPYQRVTGRTLGVIGFGHIARCLVRKMSGFDQTICVYDPYVQDQVIEDLGAKTASLDEMLMNSDWVSVHCPLLPQTRNLIGERELRLMKNHAFLINTARGPIVDEAALITALQEGWISGAGLDVFEQEPIPPDHPILGLDNVVLTPHIAGYSDQTHHNFWSLSVEMVIDMSNGRWPRSCVNPEVKPRWPLN